MSDGTQVERMTSVRAKLTTGPFQSAAYSKWCYLSCHTVLYSQPKRQNNPITAGYFHCRQVHLNTFLLFRRVLQLHNRFQRSTQSQRRYIVSLSKPDVTLLISRRANVCPSLCTAATCLPHCLYSTVTSPLSC